MGEGTRNMEHGPVRVTPSAGPNSDRGQGQISPISLQLPALDPNNGVVEIFESMCKFPVAAEYCRMFTELRRTNNFMNFKSHCNILFKYLKTSKWNYRLHVVNFSGTCLPHAHVRHVMMMATCHGDKGGMMMMGETEGRRTRRRGEDRAPEQETHQD